MKVSEYIDEETRGIEHLFQKRILSSKSHEKKLLVFTLITYFMIKDNLILLHLIMHLVDLRLRNLHFVDLRLRNLH